MNTLRALLYTACITLSVQASSFAQSNISQVPSDSSVPMISEGTGVMVVLKDELFSGKSQSGQAVHFEVANDVSLGTLGVVIPKGALAFGKVTESKRAGMFGQSGKLAFTCDYVCLPNGRQVPLRASVVSNRGGDSRGASIVCSIMFSPLALLANGGNAKAHTGQELTVYVDHDTAINSPVTSQEPSIHQNGAGKVKSLFALAGGGQVIGTLASFDGSQYVVATDTGTTTLKASDVKAIYALENIPSTQTPPTAPVSQHS